MKIIINLLSSEFPEIVTAIGAGVNAHPLTSTGQPKIFIHVGGGEHFFTGLLSPSMLTITVRRWRLR